MEVDAGAMFEWGGGAQELKADVDARRGAKTIRRGEHHAAFECGVLDAGEIDGGALACRGARRGFSAGSAHRGRGGVWRDGKSST